MKSKKSWELSVPSALKSAAGLWAKKAAMKSKKSWLFTEASPFQSARQEVS